MKKVILLFLIFVLVFLNACSNQSNLDDTPFEETMENYNVKYENGIITYSAKITKPTPCYTVNKEEIIMESYSEQIIININLIEPSLDVICIQIIEEETIEGIINLGHKPASFQIKINGETVYSTNLKNE